MLSVIFGLGGLVLLVACPILIVWGFWRAVIFTGVEVAAEAAEKTQGATFADKQKKWGYYIMLVGLASGPLGFWFLFYLANYFS